MIWGFLAKKCTGRQSGSNNAGSEFTPPRRRYRRLQRTGAAKLRQAAGKSRSLPPCVLRHLLLVAAAPPPSTAACEHHQWSRRSPVWLTGDRGLCCAPHQMNPTASRAGRGQEASRYERRAGVAPSVTSTSRPSSVGRSRFRAATRWGAPMPRATCRVGAPGYVATRARTARSRR